MKTFELKTIDKFSYKESLIAILSSVPSEGLSVKEVRKSVKALDVLEKSENKVEFEDDIWEHILYIVNKTKYTVVHKNLATFLDDIEKVGK